MPPRLIPFLVCLLFFGCHQPVEDENVVSSINIIDRNGMSETFSSPDRLKQFNQVDFCAPQPYQKVLRVYNRDPQGNVKAIITSYYPNGQVKQYLEVVNNRASGLYQEWYSDGILKVQTQVIGGAPDICTASEKTWIFDGCSQAWDEKGCLMAQIFYNKGELEGDALYYHPSGQLWKKIPYARNLLEGTSEIFQENGLLLQKTEYRKGVKQGLSIRYWRDNQPSSQETYHDGLLQQGVYFDAHGQIISSIENGSGFRVTFGREDVAELQEYKNGIPEGEVKVYNQRGDLLKIYRIKNGVKHGEELSFYVSPFGRANSQPRLSIAWYEGKIQGTTKTWYDNGILESQRDLSNNLKNGLATAWYRDGSLMLIEEYDRDKLIKGKYFRQGEKIPVSEVYQGDGWATLFDADGHFIRKILYIGSKPDESK